MSIGERLLLALSRDPSSADYQDVIEPDTLDGALDTLQRVYPDLKRRVAGKRVVDFGCGAGRQSVALALFGAAHVRGVDINERALARGRTLAEVAGASDRVHFSRAVPEEEKGTFEVVISKDSFEHFSEPEVILREMRDLLRPGGHVLITFGPPWYAPYGSHMHYFTRVPWVNLLFPEKTVMRVRSRFRPDGALRYEDVESGLNRMSIRRFERIVRDSGLVVEDLGYRCIKGLPLARIPLLRELMINEVGCVLKRN